MRLYNQDYSFEITDNADGTKSLRFGPPPKHEPKPPPRPRRSLAAVLLLPFVIIGGLAALLFDPRSWIGVLALIDKGFEWIANRIDPGDEGEGR